jgi:ribosomal protein S18 acetylase RimI-like enzyme
MSDRNCRRIHDLIVAEQERQGGKFIDVELEPYIEKLFDKAEFVVNHDKHRCLGFVAYYTYDQQMKNVFISLVLVAPEARRTGLAQALIGFVLDSARRRGFTTCSLVVKKNNDAAIGVYRNLGFQVQEEQENKYWLVRELDADTSNRGGTSTF